MHITFIRHAAGLTGVIKAASHESAPAPEELPEPDGGVTFVVIPEDCTFEVE